MSTIYKQERNHNNWTGKVTRNTYSYQLEKFDDKIPFEGYVIGALILFAIFGFIPLLYLIFGA